MQQYSEVDQPLVVSSRPSQSRDDKLAILRKGGYAPDRCAALEGGTQPPDVSHEVSVEKTEEAAAWEEYSQWNDDPESPSA